MAKELIAERASVAVRSALFVPADRPDFLAKSLTTNADALIFDLEDSVPERGKVKARVELASWLEERRDEIGKTLCTRINDPSKNLLKDELETVVTCRVGVVMLPKVATPSDVLVVDRLLTYLEGRHGRELGSTAIWPLPETASAVRLAFEIATASPRIRYMGCGIAPEGDMARELGCVPTIDGLESIYVRSKVLLDVRAAGIANPMTGVVTDLHDASALQKFAEDSRGLGYEGMMVIHPSHIDPVNAVFSTTDEEIAMARALLDALAVAEGQGRASASFGGRMVDIAMKKTAEELLAKSMGSTQATSGSQS